MPSHVAARHRVCNIRDMPMRLRAPPLLRLLLLVLVQQYSALGALIDTTTLIAWP